MTDLSIQVAASKNDASNYSTALDGGVNSYFYNVPDIPLGRSYGTFYCGGFRFLGIPTNVTITAATLTIIASGAASNDFNFRIFGEKRANSAAFPTATSSDPATGDPIYRSPRTTNYQDWVGTANNNNWVAGSSYTSPDFAPVVQEIIDEAISETEIPVTLIIRDNGTTPSASRRRYIRTWDYSGNVSGATLNVSYTVGSGSTSVLHHLVIAGGV